MLRIARPLVDQMVAHARAEAPDECWGLLAGQGDRVLGVFPCENGTPPENRPFNYETEFRSQMRAEEAIVERGWEILGIYHSHTHTQPYPSPTDIDRANPLFGDIAYVIVSLRTPGQPFVYRGMPKEQWQQAHEYAQTKPARPEVAAFYIRNGAAEPIDLRVTRGSR